MDYFVYALELATYSNYFNGLTNLAKHVKTSLNES